MPYKQSAKQKNDYTKENYDRISVVVPKGIKDKIKALADGKKTSVNDIIVQSIESHTGLTIKPERTTDTDGKK